MVLGINIMDYLEIMGLLYTYLYFKLKLLKIKTLIIILLNIKDTDLLKCLFCLCTIQNYEK